MDIDLTDTLARLEESYKLAQSDPALFVVRLGEINGTIRTLMELGVVELDTLQVYTERLEGLLSLFQEGII